MRLFLFVIFNIGTFLVVHTQERMVFPSQSNLSFISSGSTIGSVECNGKMVPHLNPNNWDVQMTNIESFKHATTLSHDEMLALKKQANNTKNTEIKGLVIQETALQIDSQYLARLGHNFRGNTRGTNVPMDNTMAISHNGHIISAINSNIIFTQPDGKITYNKGFSDFFTLLGLGTRMYDPRVIYDTEARKFIFMCLHGSEPSNTYLCLAFSETEDPNGVWNYYSIKGNPEGDDNWFDYPNIAVSNQDYYLTGLMRDRNGDWQYSVMFQIDKNDGYKGDALRFKYYNDINDSDGSKSFNLVPTPSGWEDLLTPGMYFVSNNPTGGNTYNLHFTTESLHNNPTLMAIQSIGFETSLAPDARQPNTEKRLNTFDSRIWSAMYLDGTIHMGSHVNTTAGDVGLFYGRMNIEDAKVNATVLHIPDLDFAFPSFAAFGLNKSDSEIMINYLVSGTSTFASQEVRICKGKDDEFVWSSPTWVREGRSVINVLTGEVDRWGDYTTSGRRFIKNRVETWVTGCFGEMQSYGTWLGQLTSSDRDSSTLFLDFVASKTTTPKGTDIVFNDLTEGDIQQRKWLFEGGTPSESQEENPVISYPENGVFSVTLIVDSQFKKDTLTKVAYIFIQEDEVPPVAAFTQDKDTIYMGEDVQFTNLSSLNSKTFRWTFINGSPRTSQEINPTINYNRTGSHPVALSAFNIAGVDGITVQRAVTVLPRQKPIATIEADRTQIASGDAVHFFDKSLGGIERRRWYFDGGTPAISTEKSPVIVYDNDGSYDVTLVVENDLGLDSLVLSDFIQVGVSSSDNLTDIMNLKIFPNPVTDERLAIEFFMPDSQRLSFVLYDVMGVPVKVVYDDKIKYGHNILRFNMGHLKPGLYLMKLQDSGKIIKTVPLIRL